MKGGTQHDKAKLAGQQAEQDAKHYLQENGLTFVEQNFSVPQGEIDLIFKDKHQWVFVEVKYRSNNSHGYAAEYFTSAKRHKMNNAIMCYLQQHNLNIHHTNLRLDLIAIDGLQLTWLNNV